jgi:hypothetical protein
MVARWLSRDPLGEAGGLNLYGYVDNNPIDGIDPFGLFHLIASSTGIPQDGANGVVSNGNGGLSVFYGQNPPGESQLVINSITIHELNHVKDAYNQNSAIANDVPAGMILAPDSFSEQLFTEIDALNAQAAYLRSSISSSSGTCSNVSDYDRQRVQKELLFVDSLLTTAYNRLEAATPEELAGIPRKIW